MDTVMKKVLETVVENQGKHFIIKHLLLRELEDLCDFSLPNRRQEFSDSDYSS